LAVGAILAGGFASAQSIIQTILGGSPVDVPALAATLNSPVGVAVDSSGNVYVAVQGLNQVIKVDTSGLATVFAGTGANGFAGDGGPAAQAELNNPVGLAMDKSGNLYIADSSNNRIRQISPGGVITTIAGNGQAAYTGNGGPALSAALNFPVGVAVDASGNVYIADTSNSVVRMVTPAGIIATLAGVGNAASGGDQGPATSAGLNEPWGVAVDSAGNVYISDSGNNTVRVVGKNGIINQFAGDYGAGSIGDGGYAINALLNNPTGLIVDSAGNVYIVDQNNFRIRRVNTDGIISNYAGSGVEGGAGDEGIATGATMNPRNIYFDNNGDMFIADGSNNRVREVTASNGVINTIAGNGLAAINPRGIVLNGNMLYFVDNGGNCIRALNLTTGQTSVIAGTGTASFSGDGGSALTATLNGPRGLALDSSGNFYVADTNNQRIRQINTSGNINTVAGNGTASSTGDGGSGTSATLNNPGDVAVDSHGNLYIAETGGERIRQLTAAGIISTVVGGGSDLSGTGLGTNESLSAPSGVAVEPAGTVLIADSSHNRVLRLQADGTIVTVAGGNGPGYSGDGGPATSARLRSPVGLSADPSDNIYIVDSTADVVRQVGTDGVIASVAGLPPTSNGSGTPGYNGDGSPATAYALDLPTGVVSTSNCTLFLSDTGNHRIRQISVGVEYTVTTSPSGLQVIVDGQTATTPASFNWLPGTQHVVATPASQPGPNGTEYLGSAAQTISVPCGPARQNVAAQVSAQYLLTVTPGVGGSIAPGQSFQDAGAQVTVTETPYPGYAFSGWTGACSGAGACQVTMTGPETVGANFTASGSGPQPVINNGGIITAGAFGAGSTIAPGTWIEIYGTNLSPVTRPWAAADFNGNAAPASLSGVTVTVAGVPAYVSYVSPGQINAQVPGGIAAGTAAVIVANGYGTSDPANVTAAAVAPGLYAPSGSGYVGAFEGGALVGSPGYPAVQPGDVITLYGVGFGPVTPSASPGQIAAGSSTLTTALTVSIGGVSAQVSYDGLAPGFVGLYQFNLTVPAVTPGNLPVALNLGGVSGAQTLLLAVGQ
jgi:trimeric autotransporter adhesin